MFKRFFRYYSNHKKIFFLDMSASMLMSLIGIVYPIITREMLNNLIPNQKYKLIIVFGMLLLMLYIFKMLLNFFIQYKGHVMGVEMQASMRKDLFCHLEKLSYSFYDNNETGKIMSRMTNDLMDVSELAHHGPENLIICSITMIISFTYLSTINVYLALIVFMCVPFLVAVAALLRKKMMSAFLESRKSIAVINASVESSISGIRVTKAFANANKEAQKFDEGNGQFVAARTKAYKAMGQFHATTTFITDIFNVIILIAGGLFLYGGKIEFGDYSAFIVSVNLFISPITTLVMFTQQLQDGITGFKRFLELMDEEPEKDNLGSVDITNVKGHITLENVIHSYGDEGEVLKGVSLDIKTGQKFALVGPSGGGKTTICHLIPRFYKLSGGKIYIDGKDIETITLDSLRRNIGIVQQDIYLFNASIKENILYGRLDATDDEVIEAAKRANIHDFIMTLENGYDTQIGERGVRLSGGQKQRLSIARVFLKNPPILILDEATSALDNSTEILIQKALDELCEGRTTIVVAHRLSTIKNADEIAVIDSGIITEKGTHDELMDNGKMYAKLYSQQFRED